MFNRIAPQAAALCLSALFTVAMLASMDHLAVQQHGDAVPVAGDSTPVQVVVITGQRIRG
jgi:hypothetical protein